MHLDPAQMQRLLAGEVAPADQAEWREHLTGCASCRAALAEAERSDRRIARLLGALDHEPPRPSVDAVAAIATRRRRRARWARLAAGLLLALGAGAGAWAMPGSPVPAWVESAVRAVRGQGGEEGPPPAPAPGPTMPPEAIGGVAVDPGAGLVIQFRSTASPRGLALISLTDEALVQVRAPAGAATYSAEPGRLVVTPSDSADFTIEIPRSAPRVEIRVDTRRVFLKVGESVEPERPLAPGRYVISLAGP